MKWSAGVLLALLSGCTLTTSLDNLSDGPLQNTGGDSGSGGASTHGSSGSAGLGPGGVSGTAGQSGSAGASTGGTSGSISPGGSSGTGGSSANAGTAGVGGASAGAGGLGGVGGGGEAGASATGGTGGTCPATQCPVTLVSDQENPIGIAVDGTWVYWVNCRNATSSEIWKADKITGEKQRVDALDDFIGDAFDVAVDANYLYWTQRSTGKIMRRDLAGGMPLEQYTLQTGRGGYLAVLNGRVAATDFREDAPHMGVVQYDGYVVVENENFAAGISTSGNKIYWSRDYNKLVYTGSDASDPVQEITTLDGIEALAVDGDIVYWIKDEQSISRTNLLTLETHSVYDAGTPFFISDIAVDSTSIYWTEQGNGLVRKLARE